MRETTIDEHTRLREGARLALAEGLYRQPITLTEVARRLCASPRTLQRAYADGGSTTFAEDLRTARLHAGAELLAGQSIAVADVARLVGYRSASAFAAAFARRYGLRPAAFRDAARAPRAQEPRGPPVTRPPTTATAPGS